MMQTCIERFHIRDTLLGLTQGMRRVTNFMHLIELLDTRAREDDLSPLAQQQWLSMAQEGSVIDADSEVLELRIATDQAAVQLLTQHSSKGLEYPIVFALPSCKTTITK